jgi:hypothetical protein
VAALLRWIPARRADAGAQRPARRARAAAGLVGSAVLQIPGLDVGQGLRRAIGNIPLYLSLLRRSSAASAAAARSCRPWCKAGEWAGPRCWPTP